MRESLPNRLETHWPTAATRAQPPQVEPPSWKERADSWEEHVENFLSEHPKVTIAAAAVLGLVLGWIVKRK